MNNSLTDRIRELAKQNGTTLTGIERKLHIAQKSIAVWDTHRPSIDKVAAVADMFGVSIDTLCGRESDYINAQEQKLLELFRGMNEAGKAYLIQTAEIAARSYLKKSADVSEVR